MNRGGTSRESAAEDLSRSKAAASCQAATVTPSLEAGRVLFGRSHGAEQALTKVTG